MKDHHVVAVILRRGDQLLLCHRSPGRRWFPDVWDFPGGHVELGERPEDALRREVAEELEAELQGVDGSPVLHRVVSGWLGPDCVCLVALAGDRVEPAARRPVIGSLGETGQNQSHSRL
jgi:8-oxo-dGTP pyrophosphatase MutT (NUDIX family)